ncbi:MAG: MATE family efflux transporter [Aristaeellaceae bacterium]
MRAQNALQEMDHLPVSKAVLKNVLPSIAIVAMMLIYNYADLFFIGLTHNDYMVSGVTLASPVFMFFMAFGTLLGTGGLTFISQDTARGNTARIRKVSSFCFWCSLGLGLALMIVLLAFDSPLAELLGATGAETIGYTRDYLFWIALSSPFAVVANAFAVLVRSEGKPVLSMAGMLLGNLLNILLDPVFILALDMGCAGAAVATSIGQVAAAVFFIVYILRGKSSFSIHPKDFSVRDGIARKVFAIGFPAAMITVMMNVYTIISNAVMGNYGDLAVAAMVVAMKVAIIGSAVSNGIGQGIQPLIGYQVGKGDKHKFMATLRFSTLLALAVSLMISVLCFVFAPNIVGVFLTEAESIRMGVAFARIISSTMWISGLINLIGFVIQAMGQAKQANIVSFARNGYVGILAVLAMSLFGNRYAVAAAQPVADVISMIIAAAMLLVSIRHCFRAHTGSVPAMQADGQG